MNSDSESKSFDELLRENSADLLRYFKRRGFDDPEMVLYETILHYLREARASDFKQPANLRAYLLKVAARKADEAEARWVEKSESLWGFNVQRGRRNYATEQNPPPLSILIDPGSATSEEIGELLAEFSVLYRMCGGSGITFAKRDVKEPVWEAV